MYPTHRSVSATSLRSVVLAVLTVAIGAGVPAFAQAQAPGHNRDSEEVQIQQLKKRLAEQDRRIHHLEEEVKALLAARQRPAAHSAKQAQKSSTSTQASSGPAAKSGTGAESAKPAGTQAKHRVQASALAEGAAKKLGVQSVLAPIHFGGDVYLFQYVPVGISGARPRFELYAFSALLDGQKGPWGFHADYRFRTTKLRSFFPGNTWLQQGYVRYRTPWGEFKAGSFYKRVGLDWDDSFFGNIQYFDGLKLDPEYGLGFEGSHSLSGRLGAEYSLQYFSTDSGINGSLPGRDFVSEPVRTPRTMSPCALLRCGTSANKPR
ncbi:MAG TPA: hypothetical protein VMW54_08310 [Terriglobia bacterium]|nr:hypothetical protein [Terriglobia bacterium]